MKKVLTLLAIMAIAMGMVFADGTGSVSGEATGDGNLDFSSNNTATLDVTLDLTDGRLGKYFEIGFASEAIGAIGENNVVPTAKVLTSLALTETTSGGDVQNAADTAFIYWIVKGANVDISMQTGSDMTTTEDSNATKIKWKASTATSTNGEGGLAATSSSGAASAEKIADVNAVSGDSTAVVKSGSIPLTVSTVDLLTTSVVDGSYSGTLTLSISASN